MKKKILHVISSVSAGGVESLVVSLIENFDRDRYTFELAVFNPNQPIHKQLLESLGVKVNFISTAGVNNSLFAKVSWRIKAVLNYVLLLLRNQYYVVHCHNYDSFGLYVLFAALRGIPIRIVHSHNAGSVNEKRHVKFFRRVKNLVCFEWLITHKIGCSQMAVEWLFGSTAKSQVIYNGVDKQKFAVGNFDKDSVTAKYNLNEGIHFLHVGRFNTQKNQRFLLEVFHEITKQLDDAYLILVGFGPLRQTLNAKVTELGCDSRVKFLPFDTSVPELLAGIDFFLLPSLWEGLPITGIEAQFAGVPVFFSNKITHEVDIGMAIYLPLEKGAEYWADYIVKSIREKNYPKEIINERAKLFDIKNVVKQFEKLYSFT